MDTQMPQYPQDDDPVTLDGEQVQPEQQEEPDRKTILKAVIVASVVVSAILFFLATLQSFFAADDPKNIYRDIADARARITDYAKPRQVSKKTFTLFVPQNSRDLKKYEVGFDDFKGNPVLVVFWASWCQPCRREIRILDTLYEELTDLGLHVVPIMTSDKSGIGGARHFFKGDGIEKLPLFLDHGSTLLNEFQVRSLPQLYFINAEGAAVGFSSDLDIKQDAAKDLLRSFARTGELPR